MLAARHIRRFASLTAMPATRRSTRRTTKPKPKSKPQPKAKQTRRLNLSKRDSHERLTITSTSQLRTWLDAHHLAAPGLWLITYKRHHEHYVAWNDIVRELLCFGWIDSTRKRVDEDRTSLLCVRRRPTSTWSAANKRHVQELLRSGLMMPAGQEAIDVAKSNGSWEFLESIDAMVVPDDLQAELDANPGARAGYDAVSDSQRRGALHRIKSAKRAQTRSARIAKVVARCIKGERTLT